MLIMLVAEQAPGDLGEVLDSIFQRTQLQLSGEHSSHKEFRESVVQFAIWHYHIGRTSFH